MNIMASYFFFFVASVLAIFRIILYPIFGESSSVVSAVPISLYAIYLLLVNKKELLVYLIVFAIVFSLPTFFQAEDLEKIIPAIIETIIPYILFTALPLKSKKIWFPAEKYLQKLSVLLLIGLVMGMLLQYTGYPLPVINEVPVNPEFHLISTTRFSSLVGTSGPFALSLAYIVIACSFLYSNSYIFILGIGCIFELLSLSRSGLAVLSMFILIDYILSRKVIATNPLVIRRSRLFAILLLSVIVLGVILYQDLDVLSLTLKRFFLAFNFNEDAGSSERIARATSLLTRSFVDPFAWLIGHGTGSTARILGGEQGESQIVKMFYEWGIFGCAFVVYLMIKMLTQWNIDRRQLSLIIVIIANMTFLQVFTSPPVYVSMAIAVWSARVSSCLVQNHRL